VGLPVPEPAPAPAPAPAPKGASSKQLGEAEDSDDPKPTPVELGSDVLLEPQYTTAETERYEDLGVLSERGGLSTVCKAKDRSTGRMVAAKLHDNRADFEKELANLKRAQEGGAGDHVVHLHDFDEDRRILFLELAEHSLDETIRINVGMDDNVVKVYLKSALDILECFHERLKMAHGDLKAENMLVCPGPPGAFKRPSRFPM
jgi:hypothetical protein